MFSKTTFVFALLALFAVQSSSARQVERVNERALDDWIDKANEAIQKLIDVVNSSIESAIGKLDDIKNMVVAQAQQVIAEVEKHVNDAVASVNEQISNILEQTGILSDEAKECVDVHMVDLEKLPQHIMDKLHQCINDQLDEANNIIEEAKGTILLIKDELASLPEKLKECNTSLTCILKLTAQVVKDMSTIPLKIAGIVTKTIEFMGTITIDLKACAAKTALQATQEAVAIGIEVAKCVGETPESF